MLSRHLLIGAAALLTSTLGQLAFAGKEVGNGGDVLACPGKPAVMMDYSEALLPSGEGASVIDVEHLERAQVVAFVTDRLKPYPDFELRFSEALRILGPIESWRQGNLQQPDDSGEAYVLPPGCRKLRAATRQYDEVFANPEVIALLSEGQKGILEVHEAFYSVQTQNPTSNFWAPEVRLAVGEALRISSEPTHLASALSRLYGQTLSPKSSIDQLYFYLRRARHLSDRAAEFALCTQDPSVRTKALKLIAEIRSTRERILGLSDDPSVQLDSSTGWKIKYWIKDLNDCESNLARLCVALDHPP